MTTLRSSPRTRRGYALVEVAMSVLILIAAMSLALKLVAWVAAERRTADRRLWAVQEVSNVMERLTSEPFDKVTTEKAKALVEEAGAPRVLPGANWSVEVVEQAAGPETPGKRVALQLRWKTRSGEWDAPVRLSAWVYRGRDRS
jgi:Tfp pilus assembly protein PilV